MNQLENKSEIEKSNRTQTQKLIETFIKNECDLLKKEKEIEKSRTNALNSTFLEKFQKLETSLSFLNLSDQSQTHQVAQLTNKHKNDVLELQEIQNKTFIEHINNTNEKFGIISNSVSLLNTSLSSTSYVFIFLADKVFLN